MERYLILHNITPSVSDWAQSVALFDFQECNFDDAPIYVRNDGDKVIDVRWLLQKVDTIKYDGVIAYVEGEKLKGIWGNHKKETIAGKRFSVIQVEHHEDLYRKYSGIIGYATMKSTKEVTEYPQAEYTFDHELIHSLCWLRGITDWLHINVKIKRYKEYRDSFKALEGALPEIKEPKKTMDYVLKNVKNTIIINAGHHLNDSGAVSGSLDEASQCMAIAHRLEKELIRRGYQVYYVPDNLDLRDSIAYANSKAPNLNDGLAIDIHLNASVDPTVRGTEVFHGTSETSKKIASTLSQKLSEALGTKNRGAKPDTATAVGSLGWIRQTTMWATLIEVGFITNLHDMDRIMSYDYEDTVRGIVNGIDELFGNTPSEVSEEPQEPVEEPLNIYSSKELLEELLKRENTK